MTFPSPFPQVLNHYAVGVGATMPVSDLFLTILPGYRGAQAFADAARYKEHVEREAVALRARESFYRHAQARGGFQVAKDAVQLLETYLLDLESLVAAGVASKPDLADAKAQLAHARLGLSRASAGVDVTAVVLRRLLNLPDTEDLALGEGLGDGVGFTPPATSEQLLRLAMQDRAEVKALRSVVHARKKFVKAKHGSRLPHVAVNGNVNYANPNTRVIPLQDEFSSSWDVSLILSWSPNDFSTARHETERAELDLIQAEADLRSLQDGLAIAATSAFTEYRTAQQEIQASTQGLAAAEEGYRARRDLLTAGAASSTEVLNAETRLRRAQLEFINAHANLRIALSKLMHIVGRAAP
jgi:outer membrane protein TolC